MIADAVDQYKMQLVDFTPETVKKFKSTFPPYYQCANPMDLTGSGIGYDEGVVSLREKDGKKMTKINKKIAFYMAG